MHELQWFLPMQFIYLANRINQATTLSFLVHKICYMICLSFACSAHSHTLGHIKCLECVCVAWYGFASRSISVSMSVTFVHILFFILISFCVVAVGAHTMKSISVFRVLITRYKIQKHKPKSPARKKKQIYK